MGCAGFWVPFWGGDWPLEATFSPLNRIHDQREIMWPFGVTPVRCEALIQICSCTLQNRIPFLFVQYLSN
jgi:hypothetical protein